MKEHINRAIEYLNAELMCIDKASDNVGVNSHLAQIELSSAIVELCRSRQAASRYTDERYRLPSEGKDIGAGDG